MNIDIIKESTVEYIENIYALSMTYIMKNNNLKLKNLIKELILFEDKIRISNNLKDIDNYKKLANNIIEDIEEIINE